jgi:quinate dehydrogenase (quinone)
MRFPSPWSPPASHFKEIILSSVSDISRTKVSTWVRVYAIVLAVILLLVGAYFLYGGYQLFALGGSAYYLVAGVTLIASAVLLFRADVRVGYLYSAFFLITLVWALWETGLKFWPLAARLGMFAVLGLLIAICLPNLRGAAAIRRIRPVAYGAAGVLAIALIGAFAGAFSPAWLVAPDHVPAVAADYKPAAEPNQWTGFGRTAKGEQFSPDSQINRGNIDKLEVAWTFHTGDMTGNGRENQNTPLQIGNTLYPCTPTNQVFAVRGDTGEKLWHWDPKVTPKATANWMRCRSLAYYDVPGLAADAPGKRRIYVTTGDMRLVALDAATGKPVPGFGDNGTVFLATGMGAVIPGYYNPTSGPFLAGKNLIVGGWVMDNQSADEPSGVVRAFDAETGKLAWAWDVGRPGQPNPPAAGQSYTRSTPNMWATPSYDAALNMVYLRPATARPTCSAASARRPPIASAPRWWQ